MDILKKIKYLAYKGRQTKDVSFFADIYIEADQGINSQPVKVNEVKKVNLKVNSAPPTLFDESAKINTLKGIRSKNKNWQQWFELYAFYFYYVFKDKSATSKKKPAIRELSNRLDAMYNMSYSSRSRLIHNQILKNKPKNPIKNESLEELIKLIPQQAAVYDITVHEDNNEYRKQLKSKSINQYSGGIYIKYNEKNEVYYIGETFKILNRFHRGKPHHRINFGDNIKYIELSQNTGSLSDNTDRQLYFWALEQLLIIHVFALQQSKGLATIRNDKDPTYSEFNLSNDNPVVNSIQDFDFNLLQQMAND